MIEIEEQDLRMHKALIQINERLSSLPIENQSFYQEILEDLDYENFDLIHEEIFALLNYEFVLLSLKKIHKSDITPQDLNQLTPWVRADNRNNWLTLLNTYSPEHIFSWLDRILISRKKFLNLFAERYESEDGESKIFDAIKKEKERQLWAAELSESLKISNYGTILTMARNSLDVHSHIEELMELLKEEKQHLHFYENLLAIRQDREFRTKLVKVLHTELAICSLDEKLEITAPKLTKLIKMLDDDIRQYYINRNTKVDPAQLFHKLKTELNLRKIDLICQMQSQRLEEQEEKKKQTQMLKEQEERVRLAQEQKEQQENERQAHILKKQQDRIRQEPTLLVLRAIHFDIYLKRFENKANQYKSKNKECMEAFNAANTLIGALKTAKTNFINSDNPIEIKKAHFKQACLDAITASRDVLEQHRGWKQALADFASVIASVISFGTANLITGRGIFGLFPTKTDSQNQLDDFEMVLYREINNPSN